MKGNPGVDPLCLRADTFLCGGHWGHGRRTENMTGHGVCGGLVVTFVLFKVKPDQQGPFLSMTCQASVPLGPQESGLF